METNKKHILEWYSLVKDDEIRNKLLVNYNERYTESGKLDIKVNDIETAIVRGFDWNDSQERYRYWYNLYKNPPELLEVPNFKVGDWVVSLKNALPYRKKGELLQVDKLSGLRNIYYGKGVPGKNRTFRYATPSEIAGVKSDEKVVETLKEFPKEGQVRGYNENLFNYLNKKSFKKKIYTDFIDKKIMAWNKDNFWPCEESSSKPEYTIEQLQPFIKSNKKEKTWTKEDFQNTKIAVKNSDEATKLQKFLFSLGIKWITETNEISRINSKYFFINDKDRLTHSTRDTNHFNGHEYKEIKYEDIFSNETEIIKPITTGKVILNTIDNKTSKKLTIFVKEKPVVNKVEYKPIELKSINKLNIK